MSISTPEPRDRDSIIGPKRLLGVLAGNDVDLNLVRAWADSADVIIAADLTAARIYYTRLGRGQTSRLEI